MSIICHWIKNLSISRLSLDNRFCNTFIFTYSSCSRGQPGRSADSDHVIFVTCWILVKITIRFYQRNWKIPFRTSNVEVIGKNRRDEYMWSLCTFFKMKIRIFGIFLKISDFSKIFEMIEKQSFMFKCSNIVIGWRKWFEIDSISTSKIGNGFWCSFFFLSYSFNHFKFDLKWNDL